LITLNWQIFLEDHSVGQKNGPITADMVRKGTEAKAFGNEISRFPDKYDKDQISQVYLRPGIQRYGNVYLHSDFDKNGNVSGGRIQYVRLFTIGKPLMHCLNKFLFF
jgi:hypothetical protein